MAAVVTILDGDLFESSGISSDEKGIVENCWSVNNIISGPWAGGIVAYPCWGASVEQCFNSSEVTGTGSSDNVYAGGIIGWTLDGDYLVRSCYNIGTVTSEGYASGIAGYDGVLGYGQTIYSSYNLGTVKGKYAGGISAYGSAHSTISNCYNAGTIEGTTYTGGIISIIVNDTGYKDSIQNSYSMTYALYEYADTEYAYSGDEDFEIINSEGKLTESDMKDESMIKKLNTDRETDAYYVQDTGYINNGYPILSWQE